MALRAQSRHDDPERDLHPDQRHPDTRLGLGTWFIDDDQAAETVQAALEIGYRNIDTAQAYADERGVGEGVRASGVPWGELFVSTKLAAEIKDYDGAVAAIEASLRALDLGYIDLMLIHALQPWNDFRGCDYAEGNDLLCSSEKAQKEARIRRNLQIRASRQPLRDLG